MTPSSNDAFTRTRLLAHHAAQVVAAPAHARLPHRDDHTNRNLGWSPDLSALVGRGVENRQAALLLGDEAEWAVLEGGVVADRLPVSGSTLEQALAWLSRSFPGEPLSLPGYDLPHHAVQDAQPFPDLDPEVLRKLAVLYGRARAVLVQASRIHSGTEVRIWPHHFDAATRIDLDDDGTEDARSIGISFTPGDPSRTRPYLSVSPWPYPDPATLPDVERGTWHTDGFTAVVCQVETVTPERAWVAFVDEAVQACRDVLTA